MWWYFIWSSTLAAKSKISFLFSDSIKIPKRVKNMITGGDQPHKASMGEARIHFKQKTPNRLSGLGWWASQPPTISNKVETFLSFWALWIIMDGRIVASWILHVFHVMMYSWNSYCAHSKTVSLYAHVRIKGQINALIVFLYWQLDRHALL